MNISFEGKTVLITGGTSDLGRVMVRQFAKSGANVAIHYLKNSAMAETLRAEAESYGVRAAAVQANVTKSVEVESMRDKVASALGMPQIVVCNAVSQYPWTTILDQPLEHFADQFETCTIHNVLMAKAFVPDMVEKKYGRFIGINTECSALCNPNSGAYAAAKRGMDGIYRTLAKEIGYSGVTCNQIAPGWMISDRDRARGTEHPPEAEAKIPMKRRGEDIEIANAALFLASDLAGYITGAYIPVCGGNVMPGI
ncbi:MAG: SDR family oxidoreductase [Oscillospiraceae bacterium]|jgi:3-oxoacyl-[acyl-carrier protein] reductase|nr:SDR family oxidoreductase [Oscillospiraceae bacterium]